MKNKSVVVCIQIFFSTHPPSFIIIVEKILYIYILSLFIHDDDDKPTNRTSMIKL